MKTVSTNDNNKKPVYHIVDLEEQVKEIKRDLKEIKRMVSILLVQNNN